MSAREEFENWLKKWDVGHAVALPEKIQAVLDEHAHGLAEKVRAHLMANEGLANWQRHILYGLAGETFEAQEALDKFEAALRAEYADLIDPQAK